MSVLVLVLAKDETPWTEIELQGQETTWKTIKDPSIEVLRYVGLESRLPLRMKISEYYWKLSNNPFLAGRTRRKALLPDLFNRYLNGIETPVEVSEKTLRVQIQDRYYLIGVKTIAAFKYCLEEYQFDFLYRTNISSYIDLNGLAEFSKTLPDGDLYAGPMAKHNEISFASGSGYLLSSSLLQKIVDKSEKWNHLEIDDVALGDLVSQIDGVKKVNITRIDFVTSSDVDRAEQKSLDLVFHYRCKNIDKRQTIEIMQNIYRRKTLHE
jgi:hypothetical protein